MQREKIKEHRIMKYFIQSAIKIIQEEYNKNLVEYIKNCENPIEIYIAVCKCFSIHAYDRPEIFIHLFFSHEGEKYDQYTSQYYELYPKKENIVYPNILNKMFHINNLYNRSFIMLREGIDKKYIKEEKAKDFNDICLRFHKTIL